MTDDEIPAPGPLYAAQLRQAHRAKDAVWISIEAALEIAGTDNPTRLFAALSSGAVQCRWQHPGRWWQLTPVPPRLWGVARISGVDLIGPNGTSLEGAHQVFRIHEKHWREWLGQKGRAEAEPQSEPKAEGEVATEPGGVEARRSGEAVPVVEVTSAPGPADNASKRFSRPAPYDDYIKHQDMQLALTGQYASRIEDEAWAHANGYASRFVRDVLRKQFRKSLTSPEQVKFQKSGKAGG